jgi:CubicO group peptidase (beta-lactamase class C family)
MKTLINTAFFILLLFVAASCDKTVEVGPNNATLNTDDLVKSIAKRLDGKCVGYQLVISVKGSQKSIYAYGDARLTQDGNARPMSVTDKFNLASCSKTITAAALLHVLNAQKKSTDDLIYPYLPAHWSLSTGVKTITFKELLTHRSGFSDKTYGSDYANLKKLAGESLKNSAKPEVYNNANYALMRLLIVSLAGHAISAMPDKATPATVSAIETTQAQQYADSYISYCQRNVLGVSGSTMSSIVCKPTDATPARCYQFPKDGGSGTDFGDMTLTNAERGWNMTSVQMAAFFSTLHYTEKILPKSLSDMMKADRAGYDIRNQTPGTKIGYYAKNGFYPGKFGNKATDGINFGKNFNSGQLESWFIGFDNDVQISFIANSQVFVTSDSKTVPNGDLAIGSIIAAFDEWYQSDSKK